MNSTGRWRTLRAVGFSVSALIAAVAGMKLRSRRTSRPNSYLMSHSVTVAKSPQQVFEFITYRMKDHNLSLAAAYQTFALLHGDGLTLGAVFVTEEFDHDEGVRNECVVREVVPNRLIHMASTPSHILRRMDGQVKEIGTCNAYVYIDLADASGRTQLTQTIVIEMPNFVITFITDLLSVRQAENPWQRHLVEELESLKVCHRARTLELMRRAWQS